MKSVSALIISLACLITASGGAEVAQQHLGFDCDDETPCKAINESCINGYCKCEKGYIRNDLHCFPERIHGETCFFDIQCSIYPMVCAAQLSSGVKRCDCQSFYTWNEEAVECQLAQNVSALVSKLEQRWNYDETIMGEANAIFPGIVGAGIMVLVIFAILAAACATYGCYWGSWNCRKQELRTKAKHPSTSVSEV